MLGVPGLVRAYTERQRRADQCDRERRRRRQGHLSVRAGHDPLLPLRGAHPRAGPDLRVHPRRRPPLRARSPPRTRREGGQRVGRLRNAGRTAFDARSRSRSSAGASRATRATTSRSRWCSSPPVPPGRATASRRAAWTCARSSSRARRAGCCPAASRASRGGRDRTSSTRARAAARRTPGWWRTERDLARRRLLLLADPPPRTARHAGAPARRQPRLPARHRPAARRTLAAARRRQRSGVRVPHAHRRRPDRRRRDRTALSRVGSGERELALRFHPRRTRERPHDPRVHERRDLGSRERPVDLDPQPLGADALCKESQRLLRAPDAAVPALPRHQPQRDAARGAVRVHEARPRGRAHRADGPHPRREAPQPRRQDQRTGEHGRRCAVARDPALLLRLRSVLPASREHALGSRGALVPALRPRLPALGDPRPRPDPRAARPAPPHRPARRSPPLLGSSPIASAAKCSRCACRTSSTSVYIRR